MKDRIVEFDATIFPDGTIALGPIAPEDFELVGEKLISMMKTVGDGNVVVETECITADERKAMVERLAEMLIGEVEG